MEIKNIETYWQTVDNHWPHVAVFIKTIIILEVLEN